MIDSELIDMAEAAGYDAVAFELKKAHDRSNARQFTEAVMRLGRATEAVLYAVARENQIDLHLHIPKLSHLAEALKGTELKILNNQDTAEVKKLAEISKQLTQAIIDLMEKAESRKGVSGERVRGNDNILNEIIQAVGDRDLKRRLGKNKSLLRTIMTARNSGAHASPKGDVRETDQSIFPELSNNFQSFIQTLMEVAIGERARQHMAA